LNNLPDTILHPDSFKNSQWSIVCPHCGEAIGFDGVFHWSWVIQGIKSSDSNSKIMPMDFDCVVERHNHYLIIETKDVGKKLIPAQGWTLERLRQAKTFTIFYVWGKVNPVEIEIVNAKGIRSKKDGKDATALVKEWFDFANKH